MNTLTAANYSPEEIKKFQETFGVELKQFRTIQGRYGWAIMIVFFVGFVSIFCSKTIFPSFPKWVLAGFFVLFFAVFISAVIILVLLQKKVKCPACDNPFFGQVGKFCPECGSDSVMRGNWGFVPHCNSCGKKLITGKHQNFKRKCCTHCGVLLLPND